MPAKCHSATSKWMGREWNVPLYTSGYEKPQASCTGTSRATCSKYRFLGPHLQTLNEFLGGQGTRDRHFREAAKAIQVREPLPYGDAPGPACSFFSALGAGRKQGEQRLSQGC